jgi:uncharacterized phage-associated protein
VTNTLEEVLKSAFRIIPYFLAHSSAGGCYSVTPLKLQKLLYYAQAWYLAFRNKPLFKESIEAWVHGPVVPQVYRKYKQYGSCVLSDVVKLINLEPDELEILDLVFKNYGPLDGKNLEDLTHSEKPWIKARSGLDDNQPSNRVISIGDMKNYYSKFIENDIPPRIAGSAFRHANPKVAKTSTVANLVQGVGSVLELWPTQVNSEITYTSKDFANFASDFESLSADWEKVGHDLWDSYLAIKGEKSSEK